MNKKTIITALLVLVAMVGRAQIHYRLEGNIGPNGGDTARTSHGYSNQQ